MRHNGFVAAHGNSPREMNCQFRHQSKRRRSGRPGFIGHLFGQSELSQPRGLCANRVSLGNVSWHRRSAFRLFLRLLELRFGPSALPRIISQCFLLF
jgi:hypothetical protein